MASENIVFTNDTIDLAPLLGNPTSTIVNGTLTVDYATDGVTGTLTDSSGASYGGFSLSNVGGNFVLTSTGNGTYGLNITYPNTTMAPGSVTANSSTLVGISNAQTTGVAVTSTIACYVTGTLIHTARGDVAVEALAIGDVVVTAAGAHRPIRWIGHRTIECRDHPRSREALPVRIAAHAFGENRPARDLCVSPGHSICVDVLGEVLIPASALLNGATIQQIEVDEVTYWHVELDSHDIILAENLANESYLDMGNRSFFGEAGVVALNALPDASLDTSALTHADFCRPFHTDGSIVDVVRSHLRARALSLGWVLDESDAFAGLHLLVDGTRVDPVTRGLAARFSVPATAREVWLVSTTSRPCDVTASRDDRDLGAYVVGLAIDDGFAQPRRIDLDDPLLCVGFHNLENSACRWTAGRARLPAPLWTEHESAAADFFLRVELAGPALPRWVTATDAASLVRTVPTASRLALAAGSA